MSFEWGKLAPHVGRGLIPDVRDGVLDTVTLRAMGKVGGAPLGHVATAIAALGKLPAARSLRALHVLDNTRKRLPGNGAWHPDHTLTRTLEALTKALPWWPSLRELAFDDYDVELALHDAALADAFWTAAANVEHLTIRTNRFLSAHHPSTVRWPAGLRSLRVEAQQFHRLVFDHLFTPLPELRALDVWLPSLDDLLRGSSEVVRATHAPGLGGPDDRDVVAAWLAGAHERLPRLEHLGLLLCDDPRLVRLVAHAPLARQLRSLSLAGGRVPAAELAILAAHTKLERLDLSECALDDETIAVARTIVPDALVASGPPKFLSPITRLPHTLGVEASWSLRHGRPVRSDDPRFASLVLAPRPRA